MIDVKRSRDRLQVALGEPYNFAITLAIAASLLTSMLIGVAWAWQADSARDEHLETFGTTTATQLASLSVEPLIALDAIRLGVLTTRLASTPTIRLAAIRTIDDRIVALAGVEGLAGARVFDAPIEFEGETAGYARIVVDEASVTGGLAPGPVVWLMLVVTVALCGFLAHVGYLAFIAPPSEVEPPPEPLPTSARSTSLLVVNVFNLNRVPATHRAQVLSACRERLARVAASGRGQLLDLPGTGWLVTFEADMAESDYAFGVVLKALAAAELLDELNEGDQLPPGLELIFRFGLHDIDRPEHLLDLRHSDAAADGIVLSAVAPDGCIATSESTFERVLRPERLVVDELESPVLTGLSASRAGGCVVISTIAEVSRPALDRTLEHLRT